MGLKCCSTLSCSGKHLYLGGLLLRVLVPDHCSRPAPTWLSPTAPPVCPSGLLLGVQRPEVNSDNLCYATLAGAFVPMHVQLCMYNVMHAQVECALAEITSCIQSTCVRAGWQSDVHIYTADHPSIHISTPQHPDIYTLIQTYTNKHTNTDVDTTHDTCTSQQCP
jgi:hypothetical protein